MKNFLSIRVATYGLLSMLSLVIVFHFLVLTGIVPFEIVWGGRIKDSSEMEVFEAFSITLNLLMLFIIGIKSGFIKLSLNPTIIKISLWLMFVLFFVNTMGNLFSINQWEKIIFTPITIVLAVFSLRLALSN